MCTPGVHAKGSNLNSKALRVVFYRAYPTKIGSTLHSILI